MRTSSTAAITRLLAIALVLVPLLSAPALAWAAEVTYLEPPAEVKHKDSDQFVPLHLHDQVYAGDTIRTGKGGRVEITISHKRVFRIGQSSTVELPQLEDSSQEGLRARFNLLFGHFWGAVLRPLRNLQAEHFQVRTATATIGIKGTEFGVDYSTKTERTRAVVIKGVVTAESPPHEVGAPAPVPAPHEVPPPHQVSQAQWMLIVTQDQKLIVQPGETPRAEPLTAADKADEWVRFNTERDAQLAAQP